MIENTSYKKTAAVDCVQGKRCNDWNQRSSPLLGAFWLNIKCKFLLLEEFQMVENCVLVLSQLALLITDPLPTSSNTFFYYFFFIWDTWHRTPDTWHLTPDMWHVRHRVWWILFQNGRSPALMVWEWRCFEDIFIKDASVSNLINELRRCL